MAKRSIVATFDLEEEIMMVHLSRIAVNVIQQLN